RDARDLKGVRIGVVGTATAESLRSYGLRADLLPLEFTGEGLAAALLEEGVAGKKILLPRALEAREVLVEKLTAGGAEVTVAPVYKNVRPEGYGEVRAALEKKAIDVVTFTSSSTVVNFLEMLEIKDQAEFDRLLGEVKVAVIGPITAKTALKKGLKIDIQPETYTIPALVSAIVDYFGKGSEAPE
ncbi:MAG TPA: uroporphyrinogen-III synthase, partial [Desulfurivibrionaceae bacterium]|nr:uroporphyrinogen-III synthase [Desulfurivibrionaceae bacterium]